MINVISLAIGCLALAAGLYAAWGVRSMHRMKKTFFAGQSGADLENVIQGLSAQLGSLRDEHVVLEHALKNLRKDFLSAVQKVGVVRFNPFDDAGGNFSFVIALLDGNDNGTVITSIHGRQQNRIYAKVILKGTSQITLTEEETRAISMANDRLKTSDAGT